MGIQKSEAIVLKRQNFGETSLLVNFFTRDFGKIRGLIKGIRAEPHRYGGMPLSFSHNFIVFYARAKQGLNLVTQCDMQDEFAHIRMDLTKAHYAHYFVELLDAVTFELDRNERLFTLVLEALRALCADGESWRIARIFEIRLLNFCGFRPRLDACVNCQRQFTDKSGRFSAALGGVLCGRCFAADRNARGVLKGTLASIAYLEKTDWAKALQLKLGTNIAQELDRILSSFLEIHLDKEIKSRRFLS